MDRNAFNNAKWVYHAAQEEVQNATKAFHAFCDRMGGDVNRNPLVYDALYLEHARTVRQAEAELREATAQLQRVLNA
jgi:hypothetical protein